MQAIDLWKLSAEYSVIHAALIIAGHHPEDSEERPEYELVRAKKGYLAAKTALCNAVRSGGITPIALKYEQTEYSDLDSLDVQRTIISVDELRRFVRSRGMLCDFFERANQRPEFVAPGSKYFSKKLYAANRAWSAVTEEPERLIGKSPKQAVEKWLIEHAEELGLLRRDGQPNQTGIEEICKVVNWKPEGGATATPSNNQLALGELVAVPDLVRLPNPPSRERLDFSADFDDEIPF